MLRAVMAIAVAVFALIIYTQAAGQDDIFEPGEDKILGWVDYDEAVSQAKTKYKPIMLYFYGRDGQDLCKLAETKYFKSSSVKSYAKKFAVVKVAGSNTELTDKYRIPPGQFAIVMLNFQMKELARVTSEEELKKLSKALRDANKENSEQSKALKKVAAYYDKAMKLKDVKRVRECVQILEAIVALRSKLDSKYIEEADEYLKQLEKAGSAALSEADSLVSQAEQSLRRARSSGSSRYFDQSTANRAQQKLMEVARDYPVQSLSRQLTQVQSRLQQILSEYQRMVQDEQQRDKDKQNP